MLIFNDSLNSEAPSDPILLTENNVVCYSFSENQNKLTVDEIEDLKKHVTTIEEKINKDAIAAEKAANEAKASQLFTQAFSEEDSSKAFELYSKAIELNPNFSEAFTNRGFIKHDKGDYAGAIDDYARAIEVDSDNETAYNNMAYSL